MLITIASVITQPFNLFLDLRLILGSYLVDI